MKYVKITKGYYGAREGNVTKAKGKDDKPFQLPDDEADRIVGLGIAEYVNVTAEKEPPVPSDVSEGVLIPEYDDNTSMPRLKEIAKIVGITVPFGASKQMLKALLDEYFADNDEETPNLEAENPII